jgi:hypothetical protein
MSRARKDSKAVANVGKFLIWLTHLKVIEEKKF